MASPYDIAVGVDINAKANKILHHGNTGTRWTAKSTAMNSAMKRGGIGNVRTLGKEKLKHPGSGQGRCSLEIGAGILNWPFHPLVQLLRVEGWAQI
jgi:hypothetical protein